MTTLHNEITIDASVIRVWQVLSLPQLLDKYDPNVLKSELVSAEATGVGAKRKVYMRNGKNWFEEKVTVWQPEEALTWQLTDCSFPINGLRHSYSCSQKGNQTIVKQVMQYEVKFGILGKLMDVLMIRRQSDKGIKLFMNGLKQYVESNG